MRNWITIRCCGRRAIIAALATIAIAVELGGGRAIAQQEPVPLAPRSAEAAPLRTDTSPLSWSRGGLALGITVGGIIVGLAIIRKLLPGMAPGSSAGTIEILSQRSLGPRGTVYTVRCGPRVLVLGATLQQITTLAEIADPDEIDQFLPRAAPAAAAVPRSRTTKGAHDGDLKGQVHGMLEKLEAWNARS